MQNEFLERFETMFDEQDGRLRIRKRGEKYGAMGPLDPQLWEPCFCWNCGVAGGFITKGTPIYYICQKCHETYGALPVPMVPGTEHL